MSKKFLLLPAVLLSLFFGSESSAAAPCFIINSPYYQNPGTGPACFHWPDTDRSNKTTVRTYVYQPSDATFNAPINTVNTAFRGSQTLLNTPNWQVGSSPATCDAGWTIAINLCARNFTVSCGATPAGYWSGCADFVYWYEWDGSQWVARPHLGRVRVRIDTAGLVYGNGEPWSWDELDEGDRRLQAICHENVGHGLGMTHLTAGNPPGPGGDPSHESCLRWYIGRWATGSPFGATILGDVVRGQILTNHNHNDPSNQWGNTASLPLSPVSRKPMSIMTLKPQPDKGVYQLPEGFDPKHLPKNPKLKFLSAPSHFTPMPTEEFSPSLFPSLYSLTWSDGN